MWENASDTRHELVANAMRRDRFEAILTNFHLSDDNCLNDADKFSKVRALVKHLNKKFLEHAPVKEFYNFDESICEYYGRHGSKQFLRGKPIRFGFKIWCGTTTLGYLVWFDPYQGKKATSSLEERNSFGLRGHLVYSFADVLQSHIQNEVIVRKWNDNSVFSLCSNTVGIQPIANASRFSSAARKRVQIQQPFLVKVYNEHMGSMDRMDQNVTKYQVAVRGKKWYWCLILYMLDAAVNNAWKLHKIYTESDKNPMDL